ncbi:MAG: dihydroorotate dehydrogenase electron transfer subunit [Bacteroidales bacterium]|nr:dihydroorotate dehydrogenase electron transfer subunit [Bacteroidales bacterium]
MSKKLMKDLRVIGNEALGSSFFLLTLQCEDELPLILPAQFAEIKIDNSRGTFLRRPISIHDVDYEKQTIQLLVKIAGEGTASLSEMPVGSSVNVVFPLGNTYKIPASGKILLVGGGVGVAPMLYTAKYLRNLGFDIDILFGYRTKAHILRPEVYGKYANVFYSTDDGSFGEKGNVMQNSVFAGDFAYSSIMACGPEPMMRALAKWAVEHNVECEVSLENKMACGIGACLCCVQNTNEGHKCVCTEGPVFNVKQLLW